jgi:hypothetical protein
MMSSITACPLPAQALLAKYVCANAYTDCYRVEFPGRITQSQYVAAFYTTRVFKLERTILKWAIGMPSADVDVIRLAGGEIDRFAAWVVENRCDNQLLLSDFRGRTRSWLMTLPAGDNNAAATELYFGSAVVPRTDPATGRAGMGLLFRGLLGFHKIYSRILLHAAKSRLLRQAGRIR